MFEGIDRLRLDMALNDADCIRTNYINYFSGGVERGRQKDPKDVSMSREILPYWLKKSEQNPSRVNYEGNLVYDNKSNDGSLDSLEDPLLSNVKSIEDSLKSKDSSSLSDEISRLKGHLDHISQFGGESFNNRQSYFMNSISQKFNLYSDSEKAYQAK
ncbi:MAG: hypothetical protein ABEI74_02005 [Candidatus Pacearchaeota archaeon]